MSPATAKAKGRRLQDYVVNAFRKRWPKLHDDDILPAIMGESGRDVKLSPAARKLIPFDVECKNVEKLNVWAALAQAEANTAPGRIPLLVFSRNRAKKYAVIELESLLTLLK